MKTQPLMAFRKTGLTACLLIISSFSIAVAQSKGDYCEPSPQVKEGLKKISQVAEEDLPPKQRRERQSAMLQELLKKHPNDFHVLKRYQSDRQYAFDSDRDALVAEYRARVERERVDPVSVYLYSRLLVGRKTKEAIEHFEKLAQQSADFPWSYLELAQIYNYPNFRDTAKSGENLKKWMSKCPSSMDGFYLLFGGAD